MRCRTAVVSLAMLVVSANVAPVKAQSTTRGDGPIYITGEVTRPGIYPMPQPFRVFDAIALAGGFLDADAAARDEIVVVREKREIKFNWDEFRNGRNLDQNIVLKDWDIVIVRHRAG